MFGRRGTLKSCSFEVPIGSDGMLPDAFPMSYVEAGGCWKEKIIGKGFMQRSYRKGFERYNMGKGSARHREGIGKALETGIGRHREGIGKQSGKHRTASVRRREGIGKASESIGKASGRHRKASGRHQENRKTLYQQSLTKCRLYSFLVSRPFYRRTAQCARSEKHIL